ncbi:MAG TPA: cation transporter [Actinomycetota bacterium]|nr:cation transporter [Actinomycetota bacterium]
MTVAPARVHDLTRGLKLEYVSLGYNLIETGVGITAGVAAGSVALIGFGLDSLVESASALILVWRFKTEARGARTSEEAERRAVKLVAVAFFALAAYVGINAVFELIRGIRPESSPVGMGLAVASLIVMPWLAHRKRKLADEMGSASLRADSRQTTLCTYLSGVLLFGLVANSLLGWWWADPVAAAAIAVLALTEGVELWRTEDFCC